MGWWLARGGVDRRPARGSGGAPGELAARHKKGMRGPARFYATEALLAAMDPAVFEQAANLATLPGIVGYSFCLPDGHSGYGFPIGGGGGFRPGKGGVSPGGVGLRHHLGPGPVGPP